MIQNNILVNNNSNNSLRFFSSLCETNSILQPSWGTGPGTFSRVSAQYITDFEGVTRRIESNCVAIEGSRVVTNLLTYSEDLSNAAWAKNSGGSKTATTITFTANDSDGWFQSVAVVGQTYRISALLWVDSGTHNVRFRCGAFSSNIQITTTPTRYSATITAIGAVTGIWNGSDAQAGTINATYFQLENVTAQTNTNPGEYVKTTSAAVSKCFSTTNGNTVNGTTGVVTEATGTSLPTSYSERQNSTAYVLGDKIQVSGWWYYCTTAGTSASSAPTFPTGKAGSQTVTDGTAVWTIGGRLLLGYVSEPASTNKVTAYGIIPADTLGSELSSGTITIGQKYQITARTDANFVADGAADNVVGTQFVATAATVTLDAGDKVKRVQWGVGEKSFHNGSSFVQNISGLTLSGDVAGALSIVDGTTLTTNAGLLGISTTGKLYQDDNTSGSAASVVTVTGTAGNTNKHSGSIWIAKISGSGTSTIEINGTTTTITGTQLQRFKVENVTPASGSQFIINTGIGDKVQFLLPDYEELAYSSSVKPSAGATATRAATSLSYPTAGNLRGNNVTVGVDGTPYSVSSVMPSQTTFHTLSDSNNQIRGYFYRTSPIVIDKKVLGTEYDASKSLTIQKDQTYKTVSRLSKTTGVSIFVAGTKGETTNNNIADASIGSSLYVGATSPGTSDHFAGYLRNLKIWFKPLSDDRCKQLTL